MRWFEVRKLALGVVVLGGVSSVWAVGYRMPHQDPEGIARGNAFVATADNPSAVYYNPAGITQLEGHHVSFGAYFVTPGIDFTAPGGATASPDSEIQVVPQFYYVCSPAESRWSYGLGVYAPYGLGADWGLSNPFSTEAQEALLVYLSTSAVVAYEVSDSLSLAAGVVGSYSEVEFQQALLPGGGAAGGQFRYEGDDVNLAFTLGVLYQPVDQWSFGLNYRSAAEMNYEGKRRIGFPGTYLPTNASLEFPRSIDVGVSYRPNENWNFEVNVDWTDWDVVNSSTFTGPVYPDIELPFNYESSFMYEFGVTRQLGDGYFVSAGYIYSENSVPDTTLTPLNPDANLHVGSLGLGHRGEDWSWAMAWHFAYNGGRTVTGNTPSPAFETSDGTYETFNNALNLSVSRSF